MPNAQLAAIRRRWDRGWFNWRCRHILQTPPLRLDPKADVVVVSQLYSPDVTMYLLAAKSFARYVPIREFEIVDDGLTRNERELLQEHLGRVHFTPIASVDTGSCPRGGCWERFFTLARRNLGSYVIQLDSDTLTISRPSEVLDCISASRTFTLGTPTGRNLVSVEAASQNAAADPHPHVQNRAEQALVRLTNSKQLLYVRGCAGFTGFGTGQLRLDRIEELSAELAALLGKDVFSQWGSEQVMSNLMASNAPNALVLPVETYPFWAPGHRTDGLALIHFFGTFRFIEGMYLRQALRVIRVLAHERC